MRITSDSNTDANKATLKRHVVRAINNLAGKDVKDSAKNDTAVDAQSSAQQSDGAASTFSRCLIMPACSLPTEQCVRALACVHH